MRRIKLREPRRHNACAAFSLTETLVGMGVVGILFVTLYSGLTSGLSNVRMARENVRSTQIMAEKLDAIRLYSWDKIVKLDGTPMEFKTDYNTSTNSSPGFTYAGTVTVTPAPVSNAYKDNMRQVTVSLSWTSGTLQRQRSMTTLIAKDGMQNYIY
jgi:uncharacterized protein (TIGR02598 family)